MSEHVDYEHVRLPPSGWFRIDDETYGLTRDSLERLAKAARVNVGEPERTGDVFRVVARRRLPFSNGKETEYCATGSTAEKARARAIRNAIGCKTRFTELEVGRRVFLVPFWKGDE
jgi:hypothetical protein